MGSSRTSCVRETEPLRPEALQDWLTRTGLGESRPRSPVGYILRIGSW